LIKDRLSFEDAYAKCSHILSAVDKFEAALLYRYACMCPENGNILEVGSDKGFSTVLLAQTGRQVVAVDPHAVAEYKDPETGQSGAHGPEDYIQFQANTADYSNITHIREYSTKINAPQCGILPIGFMFIDGNHAWPHPRQDYQHFMEWLKPDAYTAWHDYQLFPGVARAIEQLIQEGKIEFVEHVNTMAITRAI
jgi:hypothetical protein